MNEQMHVLLLALIIVLNENYNCYLLNELNILWLLRESLLLKLGVDVHKAIEHASLIIAALFVGLKKKRPFSISKCET